MKIAYTMNGILGGLSGKSAEGINDDTIPTLLKYLYVHFEKYILPHNDIDFYIFGWQKQYEDLFLDIFKPKKYKFIDQVKFDVPKHLPNNSRVQAHLSRWYGFQKVIEMIDGDYDLVVNARMDLLWNNKIEFGKLDNSKIHISKYIDGPVYGWPNDRLEIVDHIYVMDLKNIREFADMYNYIYDYTKIGNCPSWGSISSHFLSVWHLRKMGYLDEEKLIFSFTTNYPNLGSLEGDYDILRRSGLTINVIERELNEK